MTSTYTLSRPSTRKYHRQMRRYSLSAVAMALTAFGVTVFYAQTPATFSGMRDPAFAPDGRRIAVSWLESVWTMTPDGRDEKALVSSRGGWVSERDPAWSPDGRSIAFAADTNGAFDLYVAPASGGAARKVSSLDGDERWPSWTRDGRLVFSHRARGGRWQIHAIAADGSGAPARLTRDAASEWQAQVSPDGRRLVFVSDRDLEPGDESDVFVRDLTGESPREVRVTRGGGPERFPAWAPDNLRVSYLASRQGLGTGTFVSELPGATIPEGRTGGPGPGIGQGGRGGGGNPTLPVVLASRKAGASAWSPDGQTLLIATVSTTAGAYNGNPVRNEDDAPAAFAEEGTAQLWHVAAPRRVDDQARSVGASAPAAGRWVGQFDRAWQTLKSLYYSKGESAAAWDALRDKHRPAAIAARSAREVENVVDAMVAEQPLINPVVEKSTAVIASGNPLASAAGARMVELGGNIVDAIVATSFALGVVEPDASGIGGDGQAILFMKGMSEPIVIEYKDMTPARATFDNPKIFTPGGQRTASDGPTVANIPGVVAGLDLLFQKYGSKKVTWEQVLAPAIELAERGYILDEALPTTVAAGRAGFSKYPEAAKIYLPNGQIPQPGDRFINKDYAETLKVLAKEGGQAFYRGSIAKRIADDMAANGGIISLEDLAQYRAMERKPLEGRYRGHRVYSAPPPVSTGAQLIETLQILDNYTPRPGATYTRDADYLHHVIEAWRVRDGGAQIADPERWPIDLGNHLQPGHALDRFKLIDPKKAYVAPQGGRGRGGAPAPLNDYEALDRAVADGLPVPAILTGTTSFAAADAEGNMVAVTQTLSTWGGNFYVSKGLGFLYNDHFRGGRGTGYGSMLPLQRASSTSVPTLVFAPSEVDPGRYGIQGFTPRLAVGAAGNAWIPASVYEIILNVVDGGMGAQRAIEAPRMLIGNAPNGSRVQIEDRIPRSLLEKLEAMGHSFVRVGRKGEVAQGYAAVALINAAKGTVEGGAEPRRSHAVK
jgi:gamma-glutamyltranspeptidase/glutathione hydrolase